MVKKVGNIKKSSGNIKVVSTPKPPKIKKMTRAEIDQTLIDNFINLQKVLTNLAIKFDELSSNVSKLLQLFEISAKSFAEKYPHKEEIKDKERAKSDEKFLKRLDSLLDQNKTIAKGIMMMEEKIRERSGEHADYSEHEEPKKEEHPPQFKGFLKTKPLPKY